MEVIAHEFLALLFLCLKRHSLEPQVETFLSRSETSFFRFLLSLRQRPTQPSRKARHKTGYIRSDLNSSSHFWRGQIDAGSPLRAVRRVQSTETRAKRFEQKGCRVGQGGCM